jgi:sialate O-acetylesterase
MKSVYNTVHALRQKFLIKLFFTFLCILLAFTARAEITLPSIFNHHMVLQQQSKVAVWGKANAGSQVLLTTSWNKKQYSVSADVTGKFKFYVQTPGAGGPYQLAFSNGTKRLVLEDVMIGEVWLCSGQSNMAMPVAGFLNQPVNNADELLMEAENSQVRLFKVITSRSDHPSSSIKGEWKAADAASVKEFSSIGYMFAKLLQQRLKVPVGMVMAAVSATKIEAWMSEDALKEFKGKTIIKHDSSKAIQKNDPTVLFNGMINPLTGYQIKGVLWYQGEGNRSDFAIYDRLLASMIGDWRQKWGIGDWSFYYVQIAPWIYNLKSPETIPKLRENQAKATLLIPNSGMVVSADVGSAFTIHPPNKYAISKRLLYWALANTYKKPGIDYRNPTFNSLSIQKDTAIVTFNDAERGLTSYDRDVSAFELAGDDNKFYPAKAIIGPKFSGVKLFSDQVKKPRAVRYAFKEFSEGNLYSVNGLPVCPFRTDSL